MGMFKANPTAEVKAGFATVKPGTYRMRVKDAEDRNPEKNDWKVTFEFVNPSELLGLDSEPIKGQAGSLFDYVMLDFEKQWKMRMLIEALGMPWQDYSEEDIKGKECDVVVKTELYEGEQRNKVARYIVPK